VRRRAEQPANAVRYSLLFIVRVVDAIVDFR
jgi:hypothetical protein